MHVDEVYRECQENVIELFWEVQAVADQLLPMEIHQVLSIYGSLILLLNKASPSVVLLLPL